MTLRPLLAGIALFAASPVIAADTTNPQPSQTIDTVQARAPAPRLPERKPSLPMKPRVLEAPGAAWMMIPASWSPASRRI
ncbi:hypothetical protein [Sphingomonas sp.]|uniref:hypothetical protein n=1 Tax=Sphingomonas sp. TaxID=28214 RepID=UPI002DD64EAF|nr:hypothetical protein [Sphingomonas sp.]